MAQSYTNTSSVFDAAGNTSGGGSYTNVNAVAQSAGTSVSSGGFLVNYAGFLNTFSIQPGLDTDTDGLANEVDPDNDNDTLADTIELAGTAFDPITPTDPNLRDADLDGSSDGQESTAGTNPSDGNSVFKITAVAASPDPVITWIGRAGRTYDIYCGGDLSADLDTHLHTTNSTGGAAPWYETTNSFSDITAASTNNRYYLMTVTP